MHVFRYSLLLTGKVKSFEQDTLMLLSFITLICYVNRMTRKHKTTLYLLKYICP